MVALSISSDRQSHDHDCLIPDDDVKHVNRNWLQIADCLTCPTWIHFLIWLFYPVISFEMTFLHCLRLNGKHGFGYVIGLYNMLPGSPSLPSTDLDQKSTNVVNHSVLLAAGCLWPCLRFSSLVFSVSIYNSSSVSSSHWWVPFVRVLSLQTSRMTARAACSLFSSLYT